MRSDRALTVLLLCAACGTFSFGPEVPPLEQQRECNDGLDQDGNGVADFPYDPGCASELDPQEAPVAVAPACANGVDDDGDGRVDFDTNRDGTTNGSDDPGCQSASDDDEFNVLLPACADGFDNDQDGEIDFPRDTGCSGRNDDDET